MKKISTLFKKDPNDLSRVINEVDPKHSWVLDQNSGAKPTRKYDGTACAIIDGQLYKRYDVKKGREVPPFAIPCQEPDPITGHWPHWVLCQHDNPADKYHFQGLAWLEGTWGGVTDGTYELVGEKVQGNPENIEGHKLIKHGAHVLLGVVIPVTFESIRQYLENVDIEGIVFHHPNGEMCKIRKSDFGIKRRRAVLEKLKTK